MNTTHVLARNIHGKNPQFLVEKITRIKIYNSLYWKEHCFALTAELLVDKAIKLKYIGGVYGGLRKPTQFMCLLLKMLQIQPNKKIIMEFIKQTEYKYVRVLGAFYLRLTGSGLEVYRTLEPLYSDFCKIIVREIDGNFKITHIDELIDTFLTETFALSIAVPNLPNRNIYVEKGLLSKNRKTALKDVPNQILDEEQHKKYKLFLKEMEEEKEKERIRKEEAEKARDIWESDSDLDDGYHDPYADPDELKKKTTSKIKT